MWTKSICCNGCNDHKIPNLTGDVMLQQSHTSDPRATKALQDSTVHNIISTEQGIVSMNWRTTWYSYFQLRRIS
jgi:hypothetical protein